LYPAVEAGSMPRRRTVLGVLLVLAAVLAAALLASVLGTVLFAISVAYLLLPLRRRLTAYGLSPRVASSAATFAAFVGTVAVLSPLVLVFFLRFDALVALVRLLPDSYPIELFGMTHVLTLAEAQRVGVVTLQSLARNVAVAAPVVLVKLSLFAFVVYGLLYHERAAKRAVFALVPHGYRDLARAFDRRARETLYAIYVLQVATAIGTFLIALPLFALLGYQFPIALATVSAVLQFVPVVGPSIVLAGIAVFHLAFGDPVQAILVFVLGAILVAWLPDVLIRPRLAARTADLPGTLYFVGFVGGLLTLGPVGIIAGPLVVGLVVEAAGLLSADLNDIPVDEDERGSRRSVAWGSRGEGARGSRGVDSEVSGDDDAHSPDGED